MYFACALLRNSIIGNVVACLQTKLTSSIFRKDIEELISYLSRLDQDTVQRRAQTVLSWLRWLQDNLGIVIIRDDSVVLGTQQKISEYV